MIQPPPHLSPPNMGSVSVFAALVQDACVAVSTIAANRLNLLLRNEDVLVTDAGLAFFSFFLLAFEFWGEIRLH